MTASQGLTSPPAVRPGNAGDQDRWAGPPGWGTVAKAVEIHAATVHRWRNRWGGMKAEDARGLKHLRVEIQWQRADGGRLRAVD